MSQPACLEGTIEGDDGDDDDDDDDGGKSERASERERERERAREREGGMVVCCEVVDVALALFYHCMLYWCLDDCVLN